MPRVPVPHAALCRAICLLVCAAGLACNADEAPEITQAASRRFTFQAPDSSQLVSLARWAEDVADRIVSATELPMRFDGSRVYQIVVRPPDGSRTGRVGKSQRLVDGKLVQQLLLENFEYVDWQDALEAHTSLLLSGYIIAHQDSENVLPMQAPDWLSCGLAHYIDSRLRAQSGSLLVSWQESGAYPKLGAVLKWQALPLGKSENKSACCIALSWLLAQPTSSRDLDKVFSHIAAGKAISSEWLAKELLGMRSAVTMENAWRKWTGKYRLPKADLGVLSSVTLARLRARLVLRAGMGGIPTSVVNDRMSLKDLIPLKNAEWMKGLCESKTMQLKVLGAGKPADFLELIDLYCEYLSAVGRRKRDRTLGRLLAKADLALEALQAVILARERYVDEVERKFCGTPPLPEDRNTDDRLERSAFQHYVDEVEKRFVSGSTITNATILREAQDDKEIKTEEDGRRQD